MFPPKVHEEPSEVGSQSGQEIWKYEPGPRRKEVAHTLLTALRDHKPGEGKEGRREGRRKGRREEERRERREARREGGRE
jgi:hypothetical protein